MGKELEDKLTTVTLEELLPTYYKVWLYKLRGSPPPIPAIEIFAAQWAIETWWGKSCHCWNLGNAKATVGGSYDFTFFKCGEELSATTAKNAAKSSPLVTIKREYVSGGRAMASVMITPKHPWCCFRAFEELVDGAADHLELLHRRFPDAFTSALQGDARAFSTSLKRAGYYTAPVDQYTKGILGCLPRVQAASKKIDWDSLPKMNDWEVKRVEGLISITASLAEEDWAAMIRERDLAVTEEEVVDLGT